jgi:NADPH2:quinone reductase
MPLVESGKVKVPLDSTFDLADVAAAHNRLASTEHFGKTVLSVFGDAVA